MEADDVFDMKMILNNEKSKPCILFPKCPYLTAACRVALPDDGCYVYRWFKQLILEEKCTK